LLAGSRSALNLQSFKITACIRNTVTLPTQVPTAYNISHRFHTLNTSVQGSQTESPLTELTATIGRDPVQCQLFFFYFFKYICQWSEGVPFLDGNTYYTLSERDRNAVKFQIK
jgi:hypothetical protein